MLEESRARLLGEPAAASRAAYDVRRAARARRAPHRLNSRYRRARGIRHDASHRSSVRTGPCEGISTRRHPHRRTSSRLGLERGNRTADLPPELRTLPAREVEDVLCIYKDDFVNKVRSQLQRVTLELAAKFANGLTCRVLYARAELIPISRLVRELLPPNSVRPRARARVAAGRRKPACRAGCCSRFCAQPGGKMCSVRARRSALSSGRRQHFRA